MRPFYESEVVTIYHSDCRVVDISGISAVVTDPPYGLGFMGKGWDRGIPGVEFWERIGMACLPGAHLVAFGGTRTHHRLMCAIEDAGWEIRDCLMWLYGTGFPKSLDVSKAIDKAAGVERESTGLVVYAEGRIRNYAGGQQGYHNWKGEGVQEGTAPATDAARKWDGWGTALKPAWEPIVLARKPFKGTVAANVQKHGTGALNIDGCRIGTDDNLNGGAYADSGQENPFFQSLDARAGDYKQPSGRWPANLVLDGESAAMLDVLAPSVGGFAPPSIKGRPTTSNCYGSYEKNGRSGVFHNDGQSGASRFFYCAKASRSERNMGGVNNTHPTVKPLKLMEWLLRLVTPPNGVVLDPFMGSGSTLLAAGGLGYPVIGIDKDEEACGIAAGRLSGC